MRFCPCGKMVMSRASVYRLPHPLNQSTTVTNIIILMICCYSGGRNLSDIGYWILFIPEKYVVPVWFDPTVYPNRLRNTASSTKYVSPNVSFLNFNKSLNFCSFKTMRRFLERNNNCVCKLLISLEMKFVSC